MKKFKDIIFEHMDIIMMSMMVLACAGIIIFASIDDVKKKKNYGPCSYEITIVDKYETLGSTFHLIGGRATEMEYHIVYTSKANRPQMPKMTRDKRVSYPTYKRYNPGQKFTKSSDYLY